MSQFHIMLELEQRRAKKGLASEKRNICREMRELNSMLTHFIIMNTGSGNSNYQTQITDTKQKMKELNVRLKEILH